jgi:hypothetical protein
MIVMSSEGMILKYHHTAGQYGNGTEVFYGVVSVFCGKKNVLAIINATKRK